MGKNPNGLKTMDTDNRVCSSCKTTKRITMFSGEISWCKDCVRKYNKKYYRLNRGRMDKYHSEWVKKHRERWLEIKRIGARKYVRLHPEIIMAHRKARHFRKKLLKGRCEICDSKNRLELHHPDYSKPLLVITLCATCHRSCHRREK